MTFEINKIQYQYRKDFISVSGNITNNMTEKRLYLCVVSDILSLMFADADNISDTCRVLTTYIEKAGMRLTLFAEHNNIHLIYTSV